MRILSTTCAIGLCAVLFAPAIHAQITPRADAQAAPVLETITVTATQQPAPAYAGGDMARGGTVGLLGQRDMMDTPFATLNYTQQFIQDSLMQTTSELVTLVDPSAYHINTFGSIGDGVNIRGLSAARAFNGLYGVSMAWKLPVEFAERIEVLKGPSAMLNGMHRQTGLGGSINVIPKRALDTPTMQLSTTWQSASQTGIHADVGQRFGEDKALGIRVNGRWRDGNTAYKGQKWRNELSTVALDWRSEKVRLSTDLYYNHDDRKGVVTGVGLAAGVDVPPPPRHHKLLGPDWTFAYSTGRGAVLRADVDINQASSAYVNYAHSRFQFHSMIGVPAQIRNAAGDMRINLRQQRSRVDNDSAAAGVNTRFATGAVQHDLAINAAWHQEDLYFIVKPTLVLPGFWNTNIYDPVWPQEPDMRFDARVPLSFKFRLSSVGLADTLSMLDQRIQLTLGLRRQTVVEDNFSTTTGLVTSRYDQSAHTPTAALLVKLSPRFSVYANYIEGLSPGEAAPNSALNAGEILPPYKTRQMEAGLKADFGTLASQLSVFDIRMANEHLDPVTNIFSADGQQRNRGAEWSAFGQPLPNLRVTGGIAYLDARLRKTEGGLNQGKRATATPQWQGKLGVQWRVPALPGLTVGSNLITMSRQYRNNANTLANAGRTLIDMSANYTTRISGHTLTLRARIHNLTNKVYWSGSAVGTPRSYALSASMDF